MTSMNFIGLDIHKKTISYCVKDISAKVQSEGKIPATRQGLREWVGTLAKPWTVAMEATMFNLRQAQRLEMQPKSQTTTRFRASRGSEQHQVMNCSIANFSSASNLVNSSC